MNSKVKWGVRTLHFKVGNAIQSGRETVPFFFSHSSFRSCLVVRELKKKKKLNCSMHYR